MHLGVRYPRLNAWPEWFVVEPGKRCEVTGLDAGTARVVDGSELRAGLPLSLAPSGVVRLRVRPLP